MPEVPSLPTNEIVSAWLYQPLASGFLPAVGVTVGAVASYLRPNDRVVLLPARSRQMPVTDAPASSGPEYVCGAEHESSPEATSPPLKLTATAWLYQPFESAARPAFDPVTCGAVASYLSPSEAAPTFPALSEQVPPSEAPAVSGPAYVFGATHESTPDVESLAPKETDSAWLYHPFASGTRAGVAVTEGGVLSSLNVLLTTVSPPSLVAEHVSFVPRVSAVRVTASQPLVEMITDSGSTTDQLTVTLVVYQPFAPSVPKTWGVTTGGVGSPRTVGPPAAPGVSSRAPRARQRAAARRGTGARQPERTNELPPSRLPYLLAENLPKPGHTYQW